MNPQPQPSASRPRRRRVQLTNEMLGIHTGKSILYLDQNFFSSVYRARGSEWSTAMQRVTDVLDLQLLAVPYSSTHEAEADFYSQRDDLVQFIQRIARGHHFHPYYRVEEAQIVKAFQAFLSGGPSAYEKEERDALPSSVHDWDGPYSISVFRSATDVQRKWAFKQRGIDELLAVLPDWAQSKNSFEQDIAIELRDAARILMDSYLKKAQRLWSGDFAALLDAPVDASIVEGMLQVLSIKKMSTDAGPLIASFFASEHFTAVPSQQLSARLFSTFKKRVREGAFPNPEKARKKLSGFLFDVQHATTYAPYCDALFTDNFMADLLNDKHVDVERTFGCKVFSVSSMKEFFSWLEGVKARMTGDHADGLAWVYSRYRTLECTSFKKTK